MNSQQQVIAIIAALVALIVIVWLLRGRITSLFIQSGKSKFTVKAAEPVAEAPGIRARDMTSESGGIEAVTKTGD